MKPVVGFGEIMGRFSPAGFRRLSQCLPGTLDVEFAGAEANVLSSVVLFGGSASFVTALPENELGEACLVSLRARGVDTQHVQRIKDGRLGLYFVEKGANQRSGTVVYDRSGSAVSLTPGSAYNWPVILRDAGWLHLTGITPAISATAAEANLQAAQAARALGLPVSCDLNYRAKLWRWDGQLTPRKLAVQQMNRLLPHVTHLMGGREDAAEMLDIRPRTPARSDDRPDPEAAVDVAEQLIARFPQLEVVALTQRQTLSALHHRWGGFLFEARTRRAVWAPVDENLHYAPYEITHIVDRVGGGDAFSAGLIYCWNTPGRQDAESALKFAAAASCLAHSIEGDANLVSRAEVDALVAGSPVGRVRR